MKKVLFYVGHPAHFHYSNALAELFNKKDISIHFAVRNKDIVLELVERSPWPYTVVSDNRFTINSVNIILRWVKMFFLCLREKPSFLIGTDFVIAQIGWVFKIPSFVIFDDDERLSPKFAKMAFPWATRLLFPIYCEVNSFKEKHIAYPGFHKSIYMKSNTKNVDQKNKLIFILRFVSLGAHHDVGISGISDDVALRIIKKLSELGEVVISSERLLKPELEQFRKSIKSHEMHDIMREASMLISDSQSMSVEAAMIGLPSVRISDFAGEIGVLNKLENDYGLTYAFKPYQVDEAFLCINKILEELEENPHLWIDRAEAMHQEQLDFGELMCYLVMNYPKSKDELRDSENLKSFLDEKVKS